MSPSAFLFCSSALFCSLGESLATGAAFLTFFLGISLARRFWAAAFNFLALSPDDLRGGAFFLGFFFAMCCFITPLGASWSILYHKNFILKRSFWRVFWISPSMSSATAASVVCSPTS